MGVSADYCRQAYKVPDYIDSKLAIDIGANIGGFSIAYNNRFDKIIFFEANKPTFDKAVNNTKIYSNIEGYNLAVSDKSGKKLTLMNHLNQDEGSVSCSPSITETENPDWNDVIGTVETISIEDIHEMVGGARINFLKMDCENSEYEILLNKDLSKIDYIAMELHWQMGEKKYKELINYLSQFFNITGDTRFIHDRNTMLYLNKK